MKSAAYWIDKLNMTKHPEGGYFKEVYRSEEGILQPSLPERFTGERSFSTSIYFLLEGNQFSALHRIKSDETWHFYQGTTLELVVIKDQESIEHLMLGPDPDLGERLQITIPGEHWFGAKVKDKNSYALLGCTVAPGFHFDDFELGVRQNLLDEFPKHSEIIQSLTH